MPRVWDWFENRYLSPKFNLEQRCRNVFVAVMVAVWFLFLVDITLTFITTELTKITVFQKSVHISLVLLLPFGLVKAHSEDTISNLTMTYLFQCVAIANSLGALNVYPTRMTVLQSVSIMIGMAVTNVPRWKLQCVIVVPALIINAYNATFGINGYSMWLIYHIETGLVKEIIVHVRTMLLIPLTLLLVRAQTNAYNESVRTLEV
eukprot:PhF_6_TR1511/c0_g2_i1/m.2750